MFLLIIIKWLHSPWTDILGFGGEDSSQRSLEKCDSEEFSLSLPLDDDTTSEKMDLSTPLEDEITEETANDHQDKVTERLESVSSVLIEPSCTDQPEEELIYEGDVEVEETNMDIDEDTTPVDDEPQDELEVHCPVIDFETESEKAASDKPTTSVVSAPNNTRIAKVVKSPKPAVVKKPITAQIKAPGGAADGGIRFVCCCLCYATFSAHMQRQGNTFLTSCPSLQFSLFRYKILSCHLLLDWIHFTSCKFAC